jgi:taurine ABC transporter substrate-binding protein
LTILNLQPEEIASAWKRGDIDAAFIWNPALGEIKQSGRVLITSGLLTRWGKASLDGLAVDRRFAAANPELMAAFARVVANADAACRDGPRAWTADSPMVQKIVDLAGGPQDVPGALHLYGFPTLEEQVSCPGWPAAPMAGSRAPCAPRRSFCSRRDASRRFRTTIPRSSLPPTPRRPWRQITKTDAAAHSIRK